MTDFAPVEPENATGKAAELLAQVQKSLGLTPNMTKVMANSPALLQGYLALSGAVATGALPAGVREQLAIATAQLNGCEYCLSAHTYIGANIAKVDAGDLDSARRASRTTHTWPRCSSCPTPSPRTPEKTSPTSRSRRPARPA